MEGGGWGGGGLAMTTWAALDQVFADERKLVWFQRVGLVVLSSQPLWVDDVHNLGVAQRQSLLAHALQRALAHVDVAHHGLEKQIEGHHVGLGLGLTRCERRCACSAMPPSHWSAPRIIVFWAGILSAVVLAASFCRRRRRGPRAMAWGS